MYHCAVMVCWYCFLRYTIVLSPYPGAYHGTAMLALGVPLCCHGGLVHTMVQLWYAEVYHCAVMPPGVYRGVVIVTWCKILKYCHGTLAPTTIVLHGTLGYNINSVKYGHGTLVCSRVYSGIYC